MRRQLLPIYGWAMVIAVLAFAIGMRVERHHERMSEVYGFHQMFHHERPLLGWLDQE